MLTVKDVQTRVRYDYTRSVPALPDGSLICDREILYQAFSE